MTTYSDLYEACRQANDALLNHQRRGADIMIRLVREALDSLNGPSGWKQFDNTYEVPHAYKCLPPGVWMEQRTGDMLCRIIVRFKRDDRDLRPAELHIPVRMSAREGGAAQFTLYEGEKIESVLDDVMPDNDESVSRFRENLFGAIRKATSAFRPPGHLFV